MTAQISQFFSRDYFDARQKFLSACTDRSVSVESHLNPNARGVNGEELYTDVARIGRATAPKVLILSSGTHGVEGYCGSGIQVGLLRQGFFDELPEDQAIVLIHAVNPYGFAHDRRVNEDNIDLNRNYAAEARVVSPDSRYSDIHPYLVPEDWEGPAKAAADKEIERYIEANGLMAYQAAASGGQYTHRDGIFFGGNKEAWSWRMLRSVLTSHAGAAEVVGLIDVHTGLGPYGYAELITLGSDEQVSRSMEWYKGEPTNPAAGTSKSAEVTGTLGHGVSDILSGSKTAFIALEYGTYDVPSVLDALRADNWLYKNGDIDTKLGEAIKKQIRNAFYPDKDDWKSSIWKRAITVIEMALEGLSRTDDAA